MPLRVWTAAALHLTTITQILVICETNQLPAQGVRKTQKPSLLAFFLVDLACFGSAHLNSLP